jgi:hypothetical protein
MFACVRAIRDAQLGTWFRAFVPQVGVWNRKRCQLFCTTCHVFLCIRCWGPFHRATRPRFQFFVAIHNLIFDYEPLHTFTVFLFVLQFSVLGFVTPVCSVLFFVGSRVEPPGCLNSLVPIELYATRAHEIGAPPPPPMSSEVSRDVSG